MTHRFVAATRSFVIRGLLGAAILTGVAACAESPAAPTAARAVRPTAPSRDDSPPDAPCLSGWIQVDGHWVCDSGGI